MNKRLLILSGLSIIAVVVNHASHKGFTAMFWWTDRYRAVTVPNYDQLGSLSYYGLVVAQKLSVFSVAAFFFISGVFIAYAALGSQSSISWVVVRRRVINLIPPFLIWSIIFLMARYVLGVRYTTGEIFSSIFTISYSPYFFVPLLIVYYLISPFLAPLAKKSWKVLLLITALILLFAVINSYANLLNWDTDVGSVSVRPLRKLLCHQFIEYIFYFVLGLVCGFRLPQLNNQLVKIKWGLLVGVVLFGVFAAIEAEYVFRTTDNVTWRTKTLTFPTVLYIVSFIFCFLAFVQVKIPHSDFLIKLGTASLGIYLIQSIVMGFLPKITYHLAPLILGHQVIFQTVLVVVAIAIPLLMMTVTRRSPFRGYYRLFFG
jgi:peptidoglycan/LPS O-acetylase OafA/YrhL